MLLLVVSVTAYSQLDTSLILGKSEKSNAGALFDLSDPTGVNIDVSLWGFVRLPGRYRVPLGTTFMDVLSYAGGPMEESDLKSIRLLRTQENGKVKLIMLDYNDFLWEEHINLAQMENPVLKAGDFIFIPQVKRYTLRDDLNFFVPIISALITIATFIITVRNTP